MDPTNPGQMQKELHKELAENVKEASHRCARMNYAIDLGRTRLLKDVAAN